MPSGAFAPPPSPKVNQKPWGYLQGSYENGSIFSFSDGLREWNYLYSSALENSDIFEPQNVFKMLTPSQIKSLDFLIREHIDGGRPPLIYIFKGIYRHI